MYNCQVLTPESNACINKIKTNFSANPQIVVVSLARAIASKLPMPSECVKVSSEYFIMNCLKQARSLVSCISDCMVIDSQVVIDMVKTMWMVRYKAAYPTDIIYDTSAGICSEASFLGYGSVIASTDIKFIQENSCILITAYNNFSRVLTDLLGQADEVSVESKV